MSLFFRPFFLAYGGAHIVAGGVIWLAPSTTGLFLHDALAAPAATLVGFLSMLAGFGFAGAAFATEKRSKRVVVRLAILGNALNFLAHLVNVLRGATPVSFVVIAGVSVALLVGVLLWMLRGLRTD